MEQKEPRKREQKWTPSPWNKEKILREKLASVMICKRCKHPKWAVMEAYLDLKTGRVVRPPYRYIFSDRSIIGAPINE